jgi:hypothetical protein
VKWNDRRSYRIALVADRVLNPALGQPDLLAVLAERDWGVIGLPPERLGEAGIAAWMAGVADQVAEFRRHGMTIVAVLDGAETTVVRELERACAEPPAQATPVLLLSRSEEADLARFLDRHQARRQEP